ncbi:MAG: phosphoglycolate phosphatase [Chloroflexota bacterium]|nr:phosphoglycolate phosphatase [Chloroflexota bacterium]
MLFDFDFTLCDSAAAHLDCVRFALSEAGLPVPTDAVILSSVGSLHEAFTGFAPGHPPADLVARAQARMDQTFLDLARLYSPVESVVAQLQAREVLLGVVSTKRAHRIETLLERVGLRGAFAIVVGGDSVAMMKPHPEGIDRALAALACPTSAAVYVGDAVSDLHAAQAARIGFIGVQTGGVTRAAWASQGHETVLDDLEELIELL